MGTPRQDPAPEQIEEICRLRKEGVGIVRIIKIMGLGRRAIERVSENPKTTTQQMIERSAYILREGERLRLEENLSIKQIAKRLGFGKNIICSAMKNSSVGKKPVWLDAAKKDLKSGMLKSEISVKYGIPYSTIDSRLGKSLEGRKSPLLSPLWIKAKDEKLERLRLRNQEIIRDKDENKLTSEQIAEKYNLTVKNARKVCRKAGSPFRLEDRPKKPKAIGQNKIKRSISPRLDKKRVISSITNSYITKSVSRAKTVRTKMSNKEERQSAFKSRISGMISNDRLNRKPASITLPKISIQSVDF